ncbi:MAG: hypothetical protein WCE64_01820 [Bacteroidales bacterium]
MKKNPGSKILRHFIVCAVLMVAPVVAGAQQTKVPTPMPTEIKSIFKKSCMECHGKDGRLFARWKVNFSRWEDYSADEKAKKSFMICSILSDGKMPPKKVREQKPDLVPTKEQVDMICKWADSLKLN